MLLSTVYKIYRQNHPVMENPGVDNKNEQYPLLKVVTEPGDVHKNPPEFTITTPQRGLRQRWPETLSTCCMSFLLLSICLMAIYTLGITMTHRRSVMFHFKDHDVRVVSNSAFIPKSEVFFIQIFDHGLQAPIMKQEAYFKYMALLYPNLRFNIMYLIDDSKSMFYWPRHTMFRSKCLPFPYKISDKIEKFIYEFENQYPNVNISITPVSKYLNNFVHKLRIPPCLYTLYARMYTVWQYGGISMDFPTYYSKFIRNEDISYEVKSILEKFNNGVTEAQAKDFNVDFDIINDEVDLFSYVNSLFNLPKLSFNSVFKSSTTTSHVEGNNTNIVNETTTAAATILAANITEPAQLNDTQIITEILDIQPMNDTKIPDKPNTGKPYVYFLLDFIGSPFENAPSFSKQMRSGDLTQKLYIDVDAKFIATHSKRHPLLAYLKSFPGHELHERSIQSEIFMVCNEYYESCNIVHEI